MGILGVVLLATGQAYAQVSPAQAVTVTGGYRTVSAVVQPSWWHARHMAHLAHLKRLAALAVQAEYAQKLAAEKDTLTADATVPQQASAPQTASTNTLTYQGSTSMQQCIISRESGGNPYIWNASGHWGLYQFSYGTWVAHGGAPGDFGHAGPATQTAVFWQTVHDDGYSDWAPYDGC